MGHIEPVTTRENTSISVGKLFGIGALGGFAGYGVMSVFQGVPAAGVGSELVQCLPGIALCSLALPLLSLVRLEIAVAQAPSPPAAVAVGRMGSPLTTQYKNNQRQYVLEVLAIVVILLLSRYLLPYGNDRLQLLLLCGCLPLSIAMTDLLYHCYHIEALEGRYYVRRNGSRANTVPPVQTATDVNVYGYGVAGFAQRG